MLHLRNAPADTRTRDAYDDALDILRAEARVPVNAHFYAGTVEQMDQFFNLPYGGTVSFTGVITFASAYEKLIKQAPLDLLHAETDCPYVAPVPHRGARCEPWMVEEVYKKIARIKKVGEEEVRQQLLKNARTFYKL
jgi:TatD DNase family protein